MPHHREVEKDDLTYKIIGLAIDIHSALGSDHSEKVYRDALCLGLRAAGLKVAREREFPVIYKEHEVGRRFIDLLVDDEVVLELKAVQRITEEHFIQLGANVRVAQKRRGLLINFGEATMRVRRYANDRRLGVSSSMRR